MTDLAEVLPAATTATPSSRRFARPGLAPSLAVVLVVVSIAYPVATMLWRSFGSGLRPYREILDIPDIGPAFWNTVYLAVGSVVIAVLGGVVLARAAHRCRGRGAAVLRVIPMVPLALPAIAGVVGWSFLLSPRVGYLNQLLRHLPWWSDLREGPFDVYTVPWIVIITGISLTSFVYLFVYTSLSKLGPEYDDAARISGAGRLRRLVKVELPLLRPALVYSTVTTLLLGMGQVTAPLLLGRRNGIDVLTTKLYEIRADVPIDYELGLALGAPFLIVGAFLLFVQRHLLRNQDRFTTSEASPDAEPEGRRIGSAVLLLAYGVVAVGLPIAALLSVSLSKYWTGDILPENASLDSFRTVLFDDHATRQAISNSVSAALVAAVIVVPIGFFLATQASEAFSRSRTAGAVVEWLSSLPLVLPGVLLGFAFLYTYTRAPFDLYGKLVIMIVAYATVMLPHALRSQSAVLATLRPEYWHAARASGAGPVRAVVRVIFPLVRGGAAAGFALVFVLLSHEFTVSIMLRSAQTEVMGTVVYDYYEHGSYPLVAAISVIMALITSVGMGLALLLGRGRGVSTLGVAG